VKLSHRISGESNALLRIGMVHLLSGAIPLYIVNEYPKSGGTWVGQMLGRALGVPFPRNRFPVLRPSVMHGHYLRPWGMKNVVVVWRDGRDVMVSWYYQNLFSHEWRNDLQVERARRELSFRNYDNIYANLPEFIEWTFTQKCSPRLSWTDPRFSWTDFVRRWYHRKDVVHVRYEDLRRETAGGLQSIVLKLTGVHLSSEKANAIAEEFSFQRQAGRRPGEEDRKSFLRKGVVGDWRNQFSKGARETFDRYAGKELVLLGYEHDSSWIEDTEEKYTANPDAGGPG
jgi:sulfotransferase family protein